MSRAIKTGAKALGLLAAFVAIPVFLFLFPSDRIRETKALWDCARRDVREHHTGERTLGFVPLAAYQAALAKCQDGALDAPSPHRKED